MRPSEKLLPAIWDTISHHVAILDETGKIVDVNPAWEAYTSSNNGQSQSTGKGTNYLTICDAAARNGVHDAKVVGDSIRQLFSVNAPQFTHEYPCHSPTDQFWYSAKGWRFEWENRNYVVVSHKDVTEAVLERKAIETQALTDSLTGIANRRHFDLVLPKEWNRDMRRGTPISLIVLDVDYFKNFNDNYGHVAGDEILKQIAAVVGSKANRPGDLAVRLGGDEFVLLLGSTPAQAAYNIAESIRTAVQKLEVEKQSSGEAPLVTVSLGIGSTVPKQGAESTGLYLLADKALYIAKEGGRNTAAINSD